MGMNLGQSFHMGALQSKAPAMRWLIILAEIPLKAEENGWKRGDLERAWHGHWTSLGMQQGHREEVEDTNDLYCL